MELIKYVITKIIIETHKKFKKTYKFYIFKSKQVIKNDLKDTHAPGIKQSKK